MPELTRQEIEAEIYHYVNLANRHANMLASCKPSQRGAYSTLRKRAMKQANKYIEMLNKLNES